jgi:hypothetical protein
MENLIRRSPTVNGNTFGQWFINGAFECYTLEDAIREVEGEPVHLWKIDGKTAIPSGRYRLALEDSPRFGKDTITVLDVPGFKFIRAHSGEDVDDTEGCPLVGDTIDKPAGKISGGIARGVLKRLKAKIRAALDRGEAVWLVIESPAT